MLAWQLVTRVVAHRAGVIFHTLVVHVWCGIGWGEIYKAMLSSGPIVDFCHWGVLWRSKITNLSWPIRFWFCFIHRVAGGGSATFLNGPTTRSFIFVLYRRSEVLSEASLVLIFAIVTFTLELLYIHQNAVLATVGIILWCFERGWLVAKVGLWLSAQRYEMHAVSKDALIGHLILVVVAWHGFGRVGERARDRAGAQRVIHLHNIIVVVFFSCPLFFLINHLIQIFVSDEFWSDFIHNTSLFNK